MTPTAPINLQQMIDPERPYFYATLCDSPVRIFIRRIIGDTLFVDVTEEMKALERVKGFIPLKDDAGILSFEGLLGKHEVNEDRFDVIAIRMIPTSMQRMNRREYVRLPVAWSPQATIADAAGNHLEVELHNISAGGIAVASFLPIATDTPYIFTTPPALFEGTSLDIHVFFMRQGDMASRSPSEAQLFAGQFCHHHTLPTASAYTSALQERLVRFINRLLIEERRKKSRLSA